MKRHCCETMSVSIDPQCEQHPDPWDCEDALVTYSPKFDSYSLLPRFDAAWVTTIRFCPWCGDPKRSLRDQYFDALEALGFDAPWDNLPEQFLSDVWWKEKGL